MQIYWVAIPDPRLVGCKISATTVKKADRDWFPRSHALAWERNVQTLCVDSLTLTAERLSSAFPRQSVGTS